MQETHDKLTKLIRLAVGSDSEGEQLAALRRIHRILAEDGKTAADLSVSVTVVAVPTPGFPVSNTPDEHVWTAPWQRFRARAARMQDTEVPTKPPNESATAASRMAYERARMQARAPKENPFSNPSSRVAEPKEEEAPAPPSPPPLTEADEYAKSGVPLRVSDTVATTPVSFGKYEGMSPLAVAAKDPQYAKWAIDNLKAELWVQYFKAAVIRRRHRPFEAIKMDNLYG